MSRIDKIETFKDGLTPDIRQFFAFTYFDIFPDIKQEPIQLRFWTKRRLAKRA